MSDKPQGAGYIESSVQDRYSSMSVGSDVSKCKHPDVKPIGEKAATSHGYKPSQGAKD